eukprot:2762267-Rhodomonas_salina.2
MASSCVPPCSARKCCHTRARQPAHPPKHTRRGRPGGSRHSAPSRRPAATPAHGEGGRGAGCGMREGGEPLSSVYAAYPAPSPSFSATLAHTRLLPLACEHARQVEQAAREGGDL